MRVGFISRRTVIFFLITIVSFGVLTWRVWDQEKPCREWKHAHDFGVPDSAPVRQSDGSYVVAFNPCNVWYAMPWIDKVLALVLFSSSAAFLISVTQDFLRWFRRRRSSVRE